MEIDNWGQFDLFPRLSSVKRFLGRLVSRHVERPHFEAPLEKPVEQVTDWPKLLTGTEAMTVYDYEQGVLDLYRPKEPEYESEGSYYFKEDVESGKTPDS